MRDCIFTPDLIFVIALNEGDDVYLTEVIWKTRFRDKLMIKHRVSTYEAEEIVFGRKSLIVKVARGKVRDEDVYGAYGQTQTGRYLTVFFIHKKNSALPISGRDMTAGERRYYEKRK